MSHLINVASQWRSTGRRRHRKSIFGKMVLQIEEARDLGKIGFLCAPHLRWYSSETRWRDARWGDEARVEDA